jgi:hypothetical protein
LRVELAAAHGIKLDVSKHERLEQTVIDPILALLDWVLPDGPLNLAAAHG